MGCFSRFRSRLRSKRERDRRQQGPMAPPVAPDSAGPQSLSSARPSDTDTHLPPTGANSGSSPTSNPNRDAPTIPDIWAKAYGEFVKREPELANDFKAHLATISDAAAADATGSLSPDRAQSIVEQLQKKREEEQWHITFYGQDVKFRAQAEKLAKFFLWCNDIVKGALSAQPYAALACTGLQGEATTVGVNRCAPKLLIV
ncbi:NAP family protein [Apiospora arundinis]